MNIALLFSFTRHLLAELEREREAHAETKRKAEEKEQKLIDAIARAAGKPTVFERPEPPQSSAVPPVAFGPTMSAARQEAKRKEAEILERAAEVKTRNNGHHVDAPVIPNE